eukprot:TRINITY_DN11678_c2_g1_i1.p6 TRINITY_DN11678_c2_g1~~TRINITY_DN11678_c2_g1_i1.p6  ORF type:complete len:100 (-),score=1.21 TRINITY_DN11678_c2_g1_i1:793-1092(-)
MLLSRFNPIVETWFDCIHNSADVFISRIQLSNMQLQQRCRDIYVDIRRFEFQSQWRIFCQLFDPQAQTLFNKQNNGKRDADMLFYNSTLVSNFRIFALG